MAQIILDVPTDNALKRIADALCADAGWSTESGMTKAVFAKKVIAEMVRDRVQAVEVRLAREAAAAAAAQPGAIDVT